ncbi:amino acid adenylation domain-containing protein, partial [Haematococcus lacustris]
MKFRTLRGPGPWSGLRVAYYNEAELTLLHNEILAGCCTYLKEGVRLQPGDVVLDVGANLGFTSLLAAKVSGPDASV